jgi:hypothetical protein
MKTGNYFATHYWWDEDDNECVVCHVVLRGQLSGNAGQLSFDGRAGGAGTCGVMSRKMVFRYRICEKWSGIMTKDQLTWIRKEYPEEYERVMDSLYEWPTSGLVHELLRWMPKVEFMKLVHNVENWDEDADVPES